jgi:hypothetical protein
MHAIAGCPTVIAYFEAERVQRAATVTKILRAADLALLTIDNPPDATPLQIDTNPPPLGESLSTLGYPLQMENMASTELHLAYGPKTLGETLPESLRGQMSNGSPSLSLEIDHIDGHLLPGHSGAPIFNEQQRVIAVADGGLENGAVAVSWAIPAKYVKQLMTSGEPVTAVAGGLKSNLLFATESETKDYGKVTCSQHSFTKVRSIAYTSASTSADDPTGLVQLVQYFAVDPSQIRFDVYQHLQSGATFVIPAGAHLKDGIGSECVALMPSGSVEIHLQLAIANSGLEAQNASSQFEVAAGGSEPQKWVQDNQWTYPQLVTRFDGTAVRRRAYVHVQMLPMMYQDRYMFETLAVRKNVFIGAAAVYSSSLEFWQRMNACRLAPSMDACAQLNAFKVDWVSAVLGIQLTTFPIG